MFRGEKVQLAAVQREYLPKYVEWLNDWEVRRFLVTLLPRPLTLQDEEDWFNYQRGDKDSLILAILTRGEGRLIGNCGLHEIHSKDHKAIF